jgi:hypothetical protein
MRVAGLASRRWFRVAILGLLAAGLGALVVILALDDRIWAAVATLATGIPILWLAKSGVESQTTMTRMRRTASEQQAKARERTAALADVSRANARSLSALDQKVSADVGRLAEAIRRVEVIEADRIRIALDLEKSQNLLQAATVEIDTLRRGLADLADQTESHDSRIARLEPSRRKGTLPMGSRPELNMAWAMGSVTAGGQVDESNDPGSGGSSDSNA